MWDTCGFGVQVVEAGELPTPKTPYLTAQKELLSRKDTTQLEAEMLA